MKKRASAVLLAVGMLVLGACGDDDDTSDEASASTDEASEDTTDDTEPEGEAAAAGEWCEPYMELLAGEPAPEEIREVAAIAPEAAVEPLEAIADGFEADPEGFFDTEEFSTSYTAVGEVANDDCADEVIDITATDYAFAGIPSELDASTIGVTFANEGAEFHELAVMRKAEGVTQSWDEILELPEEETGELVTEVGGGFSPPGATSTALLDLSEAGEYIAVCFIPVGATPEANEEEVDGPPHFTQGMRSEFTVS